MTGDWEMAFLELDGCSSGWVVSVCLEADGGGCEVC